MVLQKIKLAALTSTVLLLSGCVKSDFAISREDQTVLKTVKRSEFAKAVQAPPRKILPQTHFAAARLLEAQGRVAKAIAQYRKAVSLNHSYVEAYHRLGILLSVAGEHEQATQMLRRTVAIKPRGAVYHNDLGFELMLREQWAQAAQEFRRAVELKPDLPRAHINLGMAMSRQGRFAEALAAFRTVLPEPDAYYNLGLMFRGQKRYTEAADAFLQTLSVDPGFTAASTQLEQIAEHLESKPARPPGADNFGQKPSSGIAAKMVRQHEANTTPRVKGEAQTPSATRLVGTVDKERRADEVKPLETIADGAAARSILGPVAAVFPDTPVFVIEETASLSDTGLTQEKKAATTPEIAEKVVYFDPKAWDQWDEDWDWETSPQPSEPAQPRVAFFPPPVPIPAMVTDHRRRRAVAVLRQVVEARSAVGTLQEELALVRDQIKCWGDVMEEESITAQEAARIDEIVEAALTKEAVRRVLSQRPVITVAEVAGPVCPVFDEERLTEADHRAVMCPAFPEGWDQVNEDSGLWPLLPPLDPIYVSAMLEGSDVASDPMVVWNGSGYLVQPIDWGPLADRCPMEQARATLASVIEPTVPHESRDILEDSSGLRHIERLGVTVKDAHGPVPVFPQGPLDWVENFGELDDVLSILRNEINCRAERKASRDEGQKTGAP